MYSYLKHLISDIHNNSYHTLRILISTAYCIIKSCSYVKVTYDTRTSMDRGRYNSVTEVLSLRELYHLPYSTNSHLQKQPVDGGSTDERVPDLGINGRAVCGLKLKTYFIWDGLRPIWITLSVSEDAFSEMVVIRTLFCSRRKMLTRITTLR